MFLLCPHLRESMYAAVPSSRGFLVGVPVLLGLTYASRTLQNYKDTILGRGRFARMFGTTQRDWAVTTTRERQAERAKASRVRWTLRRTL